MPARRPRGSMLPPVLTFGAVHSSWTCTSSFLIARLIPECRYAERVSRAFVCACVWLRAGVLVQVKGMSACRHGMAWDTTCVLRQGLVGVSPAEA